MADPFAAAEPFGAADPFGAAEPPAVPGTPVPLAPPPGARATPAGGWDPFGVTEGDLEPPGQAPPIGPPPGGAPRAQPGTPTAGLALEDTPERPPWSAPPPAGSLPLGGTDPGLFPGELGASGGESFDLGWETPAAPRPQLGAPAPPEQEALAEPEPAPPPPAVEPPLVPAPAAEPAESEGVAQTGTRALEARGGPRSRRVSRHLSGAVWLVLMAVAAAAFFLVWRGGLGPRLADLGREGPPAAVEVKAVRGGSYDTVSGRTVLVVRGEVEARSAVKGPVRVKVDLLSGERVVASASSLAGATVTPEQIHEAGAPGEVAALGRTRDARAVAHLEPGTSVPFLVVFPPPAPEPRGLELEVTAEPIPPEVKP